MKIEYVEIDFATLPKGMEGYQVMYQSVRNQMKEAGRDPSEYTNEFNRICGQFAEEYKAHWMGKVKRNELKFDPAFVHQKQKAKMREESKQIGGA